MNMNARSNIFDLDDFFQLTSPKPRSFITRKAASDSKPQTEIVQKIPSVDIAENNDNYELAMELAGVKKENIAITVENSTLSITAEKTRKEETEDSAKILRNERNFGTLSRSFNLGQDIEQDSIKANFTDGLLTVIVFKVKEPEPVQRKIEIS
ncbi:MAG: Hsp20/alpha crystallin family protein [Oceanicoccus sp.]